MKKLFAILMVSTMFIGVNAQEQEEAPKQPVVQFSGHVRFEAFTDSYLSVEGRDGDVYLYPQRANFDVNGDDLNKNFQSKFFAGQSRLRAKINGPDAFGAKINGMFEFDLLALSSNSELTPRIRHLFMNADWGKTQLLLGYSWHPTFVTECFPTVLSMGAALPFNPLNRSSQAKVTHKLTDNLIVVGGLFTYSDFTSKGPTTMQRNAGLPDFHAQLKYVQGKFATGLVAGYKILKPRLVTDAGVKTDKTVGAYDVSVFAKFDPVENLTLKVFGIYGQNMTSYTMIGGFGAAQDPTTVDDYDYSNIETMAAWTELSYKHNAWVFGCFAGYSANVGTSEDGYYSAVSYTRSANIDNIVRVSPYVSYTSGKLLVGLEYMFNSATYGNIAANNYTFTKTDDMVANNRIQFSTKYTF